MDAVLEVLGEWKLAEEDGNVVSESGSGERPMPNLQVLARKSWSKVNYS